MKIKIIWKPFAERVTVNILVNILTYISISIHIYGLCGINLFIINPGYRRGFISEAHRIHAVVILKLMRKDKDRTFPGHLLRLHLRHCGERECQFFPSWGAQCDPGALEPFFLSSDQHFRRAVSVPHIASLLTLWNSVFHYAEVLEF